MAGTSLSARTHTSRRRREDALVARAEAILLLRLKRSGRLENAAQAERFLRLRLGGLLHEELHAVWLDARHRIIACEVLAKGAIDRAQVDPRVVVQSALRENASAVILAHNHPSGVAVPSADDLACTARLRDALELFDVRLLEHFVIGERQSGTCSRPTAGGAGH